MDKNPKSLTETDLSTRQINNLFQTTSQVDPKGRIFGNIKSKFSGNKTPKPTVQSLQQEWARAGYPENSEDLTKILRQAGYRNSEVDKIFKEVFNTGKDQSQQASSKAVTDIAEYIKQNNLTDEILKFMSETYGFKESYSYTGKVMVAEVKEIFTKIVNEEGLGRQQQIRSFERTNLGRTRK
jgi:uncharacterized protein YbbK (DUF523 family)